MVFRAGHKTSDSKETLFGLTLIQDDAVLKKMTPAPTPAPWAF